MSREVDERIVAMYFDNKDFEKNAKTTIDTLGELKKELNIEKSIKGFDTLKKATENLKLDDVKRKVINLQNTFAALGNVVRKAFDIGTGPLKTLDNLFSTFKGYVAKFIGFDIAGKFVNSLESAFRQLTVAPITTGFNEYEMKMDSIKTIMSGTGEDIDTVTAKIQELNRYADQTIYSFSDMTSNIGKFTNNGVELDKATSAIKGVANATADAGQNAQKASQAMYNMSQAIGVGKMQQIDWKSIEGANIATPRLKKTFMDAAVAHGKLVRELDKETQEMKYYLIDPVTGKKKKAPKDQTGKWYEVNIQNFRDTLKEDWLDNNSMLAALQVFSGDLKTVADFRRMGFTEAMGFTDEDINKLIEIGQNAQKAATEVRTFTKMYDALKEAAQSGWGESFEWIFGNMEEGTNLWTKLNDRISAMLEKSAEERNAALAEWRGMFQDHEGNWHKSQDSWVYEESYDEYGNVVRTRKQLVKAKEDGREVLMASFFEMIDILQEFGTTISDAWSSVFGKLDSDKLWAITNGFRDFVKGLREWMGSADDANSRLSKIRKGLTGVFGILKTVMNIGKSGISLLTKLLKPLADLSVDLFGNFGEFFEGIGDMNIGDALKKIGEAFQRLWEKITNLNWDTVRTKLGEAWTSVKATLHEWMEANGLSGVWDTLSGWKNSMIEWFDGVKETLQEAWSTVLKWFEDSGVAPFFRDVWGWIKKQFGWGGTDGRPKFSDFLPEGYKGNVDLSDRPKVAIDIVTQAGWYDEEGNPLPGDYATLLTNTFSAGDRQAGYDFEYDSNVIINATPITPDGKVLSPEEIEDYIADIVGLAKSEGISLMEADRQGNNRWANLFLGVDDVPDGQDLEEAYQNAGEWAQKTHELQEEWDEIRAQRAAGGEESDVFGIADVFKSIETKVGEAWKTLTENVPWSDIGEFFGNIWGWLKEQASAGWDTVSGFFTMNENGESGFTKLVGNVRNWINTAWNSLYTWGGWSTMGKFFGDIWTFLKDKAEGVWTEATAFFTVNENGESGFTKLVGSIRGFIDSAWTGLYTWTGWSTMGKFFGDIWAFLESKAAGAWAEATAFFTVDENGESGFTKLIGNIIGWIDDKWTSVYTWSGWSTMGKFFGDIWAFLEGKAQGFWNTTTAFFELDSEGKSGFITMIEGLKEKVASAWNSVVGWEGWGAIGLFFGNTLEWIKSLVGGDTNAALGSEEGPAKVVTDMSEQVAKATEAAEADGGVEEKTTLLERVLEALGNFWDKVQGFVGQIASNSAAATAFDTFRKVLEIIAGIVSKVVNFLHKAVVQDDLGAKIELIIGGIATLIASIYATKLKAKLASALSETEGVGEMVLKVASGIALIAAAVAVLSALDETKMWRAVGAVSLITLLVGAVIGIANDTKKVAPATDSPVTGLERIASKAISWVGMIGTLFVAMKELPEIIKSMKDSHVTGEDLAGLGVFLATVVGGLSLITIVLGKIKLDPEQTATSAGAFVLGLGIIIAGLVAVFSIIPAIVDLVNPNITQGFVQKITETGNMLVAIGEAIGRFIASFSTGFKEEQNKNALENSKKDMQWLDEVAQEFGPERLQAIMRLITVFADLDNNLKGNLDKLNQVTDKLPGIGTNLAQFATNFQQVFMAKGGDITTVDAQLDRIWTMVKIYREVGELMEYIWITEKSAFDNNNLSRNIDNESSIKGMTSFLQMMLDAIQAGLGEEGTVLSFNATPIIDSIVVALGYGEEAISAAVHAMVQAGIDNSGNPQKAGEYKNDILTKLVNGGFFGGGTDGSTTVPEIPTYEQIMQQTGLNNLMDPSKFATSMFGEGGLNGIIQSAIGKIDAKTLSATMTTQLKPLGESFKNTFTIDNFNTQMGSFLPKNEKGEVDWENALKGFQDDLGLISEHLNEAGGMEIRITPVFEMTDLDKGRSQIEDYFRQNPLAIGMGDLTPNLTINLNNDTTLAMIRQTNENIAALADRMGNENASNISAINAMSSRIDGIASAVSNMRIYLDTGVLVGQVDKALGYNFFLAGRTGTTPGGK